MPDTNVNAAPTVGQGQAPVAPESTQGQAVENNSGQVAEMTPETLGGFKSPEDLYKSYQELRKDYTKTKQEKAEADKDAEALRFLKSDPRFNNWALETYSGPSQKQSQAPEPEVSELEELGLPVDKLESLIERKATQIARQMIDGDPRIRSAEEQYVEWEFSKAERDKGLTDIRQHKSAISRWYSDHPGVNLGLDEVYKLVTYDNKQDRAKQEVTKSFEAKKAASTEGPGMSTVRTQEPVRSIRDAFNLAKAIHTK